MDLDSILGGLSSSKKVLQGKKKPKKDAELSAAEQQLKQMREQAAARAAEEFKEFRSTVRARLEAFLLDDTQTQFNFVPQTDSKRRFVIREAAQELGLTTLSSNLPDEEDVIIAYKKGHEPEREAQLKEKLTAEDRQAIARAQAEARKAQPRKRKKKTQPSPAPERAKLFVLNTQKRDLRSVEQVQKDILKRKQQQQQQQQQMPQLEKAEDADAVATHDAKRVKMSSSSSAESK